MDRKWQLFTIVTIVVIGIAIHDAYAITDINVGWGSRGIAINPGTNKIYITGSVTGTVHVIDGFTNKITDNIPLSNTLLFSNSGTAGIDVNPNTNTIYVTNRLGGYVSVINGSTNSIITNVSVQDNPWGITVNPTTDIIYVTNLLSN